MTERETRGDGGETFVLAAGGVVVRRRGRGVEVVVVHRPKYDDWSFPKGKLDPGETASDGALREVREETGLTCRAAAELSPVQYRDARGRPKIVRYWLMEPVSGSISEREPDREIDRIRWASPVEARDLLSYDHDRRLLADLG